MINFILLLLVWPGIWINDSSMIYYGSLCFGLDQWQHALTHLFFIVSLEIFPFTAGVPLMQIIIASFVVGHAVAGFQKLYPSKYAWLLLIPFFLPMFLANNLHPLRYPMYAYLLLYFFMRLIFKYLDKEYELTIEDMVRWGILGALIITWRSEGIIYIIGIPVLLLVLFARRLDFPKIMTFLLVFFSLYSGINRLQGFEGNVHYKIGGIAIPLREILLTDFKSDDKERDLRIINDQFSLDRLLSDKFDLYTYSYLNSDGSLLQFELVAARLFFYNFPYIFKKRILDYFYGSCFKSYAPEDFINNNFETFNYELKQRTMKLLFLQDQDMRKQPGYYEFYSMYIPVSFIFIFFIAGIVRRKLYILIISSLLICHWIMTLLFSPIFVLTYFQCIYLCAYVFTFMALLGLYVKKC